MPKISDLPAASGVASADLVPIVRSGATEKATAAQLKAFVLATVGLPKMLISLAKIASVSAPGTTAANETHGVRFLNHYAMIVTGVRICSGAAGNGKTFKVQLWDSGGTSLASATQVSVANNEVMEIPFSSPVTIPALPSSNDYHVVSVYSSSYSNFFLASSFPPVAAWPFIWAQDVLFRTFSWAGGDAYPNNAINSEFYPVDPIMTLAP